MSRACIAGIACCVATFVAPAQVASQDLEVLAAAAGELREMVAAVSGPNGGVALAMAIHRARDGAMWGGAALDTLRSRLETARVQPGSTIEVCRGDGRCLPSGAAVAVEISEPVWTGEVATIFARVVIPRASFRLHPLGDVVLVTLRFRRAGVPGGWAIDRWEEAEPSRISHVAEVPAQGPLVCAHETEYAGVAS